MTAARLPFRGTSLSSGVISVLLLAVGVFAATYAVWRYDRAMPTDSVVLLGTRTAGVQAAIEVMDDGGPPLTARATATEDQGAGATETFIPANRGDDPGIYLYLPLLGQVLGIDDPLHLLKLFFLGLMGFAIAVTPVAMYHATGSVAVGLIGSALAPRTFDFSVNSDIYWIGAWCYLLAIPLLLAALRQRNRTVTFILLAAALLVASFASSIRSQVGLPVIISAVAIGYVKSRGVRTTRRVLIGCCLVAAYLTISTGVIASAQAYRDHRIDDHRFSAAHSSGHPFWHTLYIGLGYTANRYGIDYNDEIAINAVANAHRDGSEPAYLSPEYERTLRGLYFDVLRDDKGYFAQVYVKKAGVAIADTYERLPWLFAFALIIAILGGALRWYRLLLLVVIPIVALSFAPILVAVPIREYEIGWFGALTTIWLFTVGAGAVLIYKELINLRGRFRNRAFERRLLSRPPTELAAIAVGCGAVLLILASPLTAWSEPVRESFEFRRSASFSNEPMPTPITDAPISSWYFARALPSDWTLISPASATPSPQGLRIATNTSQNGYQLLSPTIDLRPGRYLVRVEGAVDTGGLGVGVLDAGKDEWVEPPAVFSAEVDAPTGIWTDVSLKEQAAVRVVLMNARLYDKASAWRVRTVQLLSVVGGG